MEKLQELVFKYRSYTPIPFLVIALLFHNANVWSLIVGFAIALIGELIRLWGVSYAGSETRTTGTVGGTYLVISGPFAYVRNPLYVGNILMYSGIGIMTFALFPYLQILGFVYFYIQYYLIVQGEEGYLRKTFGQQYEEYYKNVPRFLPRATAYKNPSIPQPSFDIKAGLKSERRSLQAFSIVSLIVVVIWLIRRF